jgi:hypothetical protein
MKLATLLAVSILALLRGTTTAVMAKEAGDCVEDIVLLLQDGSTDFESMPIAIVSQDTSHVTFEVSHPWTVSYPWTDKQQQLSYLYTWYQKDLMSSEECLLTDTVDQAWTRQYTAQCNGHSHVTIVNIFISDSSLSTDLDTATIPQCCHNPELDSYPKVQYTFKVHCVPQECEEITRRLRGST